MQNAFAHEEQKIRQITGSGIALDADDIDTDRIIPARYLKELTFDNLGSNVFADERKQAKSQGLVHPFDNMLHSRSAVLAVAKNFGCGSSREHAPQALKRWGMKAVVGESFGEIFRGNCASIGLACLTVSEEDSKSLREHIQRNPFEDIAICLEAKTIRYNGTTIPFSFSESIRERFVSGRWNVLTELLAHQNEVAGVLQELPYANGNWSQP